jgi:hypothetical protein
VKELEKLKERDAHTCHPHWVVLRRIWTEHFSDVYLCISGRYDFGASHRIAYFAFLGVMVDLGQFGSASICIREDIGGLHWTVLGSEHLHLHLTLGVHSIYHYQFESLKDTIGSHYSIS